MSTTVTIRFDIVRVLYLLAAFINLAHFGYAVGEGQWLAYLYLALATMILQAMRLDAARTP